MKGDTVVGGCGGYLVGYDILPKQSKASSVRMFCNV